MDTSISERLCFGKLLQLLHEPVGHKVKVSFELRVPRLETRDRGVTKERANARGNSCGDGLRSLKVQNREWPGLICWGGLLTHHARENK